MGKQKLNSCIWQSWELEVWRRVWKKVSWMVIFFTAFIMLLLWRWEHSCAERLFTNSDPAGKMQSVLLWIRGKVFAFDTHSVHSAGTLPEVFSAFQVNYAEEFWHPFAGFLQERWHFKPVCYLNLHHILSATEIYDPKVLHYELSTHHAFWPPWRKLHRPLSCLHELSFIH